MKTGFFSILSFTVVLTGWPSQAVRAQDIWTGGSGNMFWSTGANWQGGAPPAGGSGTMLRFTGAAPFYDPAQNDIASPFGLNDLEFDALTGEFNTSGGALHFLYNGMAHVRQNAAYTAVIGNDILVDDGGNAELEIVGNGSGFLRFGGLVTNNTYLGVWRGAATSTFFDGGIVNNGSFNVLSGTVGLWGGLTNNGSVHVDSTLQFNSGTTANFQQGSSFTASAGSTVEFGGGVVNFNGAAPYTATLGGTTRLTSSTLGGSADFTFDLTGGSFDWRAGTFGGTASQTATVKLSSGLLEGPSTKAVSRSLILQGGSLSWNGGTIDLGATGNLTLDGTIINASSLAGNLTASGPANQFTLTGAQFNKVSGDSTVIEIQPTVSADGSSSITTAAGGLKFTNGGTFSGALGASGTGWIEFAGGTASLKDSASVSGGANTLRLTGGQFNVDSESVSLTAGMTLEDGATLDGSAYSYNINSGAAGFLWNGGTISGPAGSGVFINTPTTISGPATKTLSGRGALLSGTWTGGDIVLDDGYLVASGGDLLVQSDQTIDRTGATGSLIVNGGSNFLKNTTTGTTTINAPVVAHGDITAATGKILLNGGGTATTGAFVTHAAGTIEFGGGTFDLNNAFGFGSVSGTPGNFLISPGATVNIKDNGATINQNANLTLAGGTLAAADVFYFIAGAGFEWTSGTLSGANTTFVTAPSLISGASAKTISGGSDVQFSSGTWTGGDINLNNSRLIVPSGGTFTVQSDQAINATGNSSLLVLADGSFLKNTTTGTTTINAPVVANGTIRATSGKILLNGGGTAGTGIFNTNAGGTIEFGGGTFDLNNFYGFGSIGMPLGGDFVISPGAAVNVNYTGASINQNANLTLAGGTLGGAATSYNITGNAFHWTGGTISGPAGTGVFLNAPVTLSGPATKTLSDRSAILYGSGTWTGGDIALDDADLIIFSGGNLTVQSDQSINRTGTTGSLIVNSGVAFLKNTTTGTTTINVPVQVNGAIRADSGKILLTGGGTAASGGFLTQDGSAIEFGGGTFDLNNATGFANISGAPGNFLISPGATVNINYTSAGINPNAILTLGGGTLGGAATNYTIHGNAFHWTGGTISGPYGSSVNINPDTTISGSATKTIEDRYVTLHGTWTGGDIALDDGDLIISGGDLVVQSDQSIDRTGPSGSLLVATGSTFLKNTTTGTTTINAYVGAGGLVSAASGKILLTEGGLATTGGFNTHAGGTIEFGGGIFDLNNLFGFGDVLGPPTGGDFLISPGATVNVNTTGAGINQNANLTLSGGTLGGTSEHFIMAGNAFHWTGGEITGLPGSSATINAPATLSGSATKTLTNRAAGFNNAAWTGGDILLNDAELFVPTVGTFAIQSDQTIDSTGTGRITIGTIGSMVKDTTTGTTTINAPVTLYGALRADSGKILLTGGGSAELRGFETTAGGTIEFGGGTYELNNAIGFGSLVAPLGGNFLISPGATVNVNTLDAVINHDSALTLDGGTLGGTATSYYIYGNTFNWTGGTITGPAGSAATVLHVPNVTLSGPDTKILDTRSLGFFGGNTAWTGGDIEVNNNATLAFYGYTDVRADGATLGGSGFAANANPGATFAKNSPGTTTLAATFYNQGSVEINAGTLVADSTATILGDGAITVAPGGTLAGTGYINNPVTVAGIVAPGHSPGALTFGKDVTFLGGSTYNFELAAQKDDLSGGLAGFEWDIIILTADADLTFQPGSQLALNFTGIPDPNAFNDFWDDVTGHTWRIAELDTGTLDYSGLTIRNPDWTTGSFSLGHTGNDLFLRFTAGPVPEPGTLALALAGMIAACSRRRR